MFVVLCMMFAMSLAGLDSSGQEYDPSSVLDKVHGSDSHSVCMALCIGNHGGNKELAGKSPFAREVISSFDIVYSQKTSFLLL